MPHTQAVYYRDALGVEPVDQFVQGLPDIDGSKVESFIATYLNGQPPDAPPPEFPITSQLEGELRELRIKCSRTRYRILYQRSRNLIVLLHAVTKNSETVPRADIELAKDRMADYRARMDAQPRKPPRAAGSDAPR